ncbi:MAG: N,N'-diacetylchitobiose phosphorylase [Lachnospiraceae bacterium]|nr:N,N'-diacetylchitobiose phosphorylase [Lachnospiraceae bacterium]
MQYGYFDDENREYVITRPDTPAPWANYLGSTAYGALISGNAGGYSFKKSGANGRILRYSFNGQDQPGRYIYLRDNETKDFWSASWQPVGKDLSSYKSECRHGLGYTKMSAEYASIRSEAVFYVPLDKEHEVWFLRVENAGDTPRDLTITGYAELTNSWNYEQDQVNLQYSLFTTETLRDQDLVVQRINGNLDGLKPEDRVDGKVVVERFFGLAGQEIDSVCGDREVFIGNYHDYRDPAGVTEGKLSNTFNYNGNSCGAIAVKLTLAPGEEKSLCFVLGEKERDDAHATVRAYQDPKTKTAQELAELHAWWGEKLDRFHVKTPSPEFDTMINTWNAYNCFMTFLWSRAASFIYCGLRNGYGYRDTVQDIQGILHLAPEMGKEKLSFMLSAQVHNGGGLPLVKFTHNAGHEDTPDDPSYVQETGHPAYRADDALWLFPTVYKYVAETGDLAFLDEVIPYADKEEGTVYDHLKRAIRFSRERLGPHEMPAGLYADWNDCLRLGAQGESSFVAFQYYYAFTILERFAKLRGDEETLLELQKEQKAFYDKTKPLLWNEDRFIRGFTEAGETIGERTAAEANMWLNPQSWAVISGYASEEEGKKALDLVEERLNTDYGAVLMDPPYHAHSFPGALAVIYNQGVKENGGVFSQSQGWLILAEALMGNGDRAFRYFLENAPSAQNDRAEIRRIEPYAYGQFTEGKTSPHAGRSHVHWLTGTASTVMVGCVEGILGIRPDLSGLSIDPAIPKEWDELTIEKDFRGKHLSIGISNPSHVSGGVKKLILNGKELEGNHIPADLLEEENRVEIML